MRPPPCHRATTAHLQAAYPFVAETGLGARGTYIGRDLFGASFCFDPWELYRRGDLTSPNMVVLGQIGRGKSSFVKSFLWRQQVVGHHAWVVDPKGEYGPLARACGGSPLRVEPGGRLRLNPLDSPAGPAGADGGRRRAELVCSLASASLGRDLGPAERTATELAVKDVSRQPGPPTLPAVVSALLDPDPASAAEVRTDASGLASDGREVALELRRLVEGDLAGMFDGPTSPGASLGGAMVVLDLSALYSSPALGLLMTCATAWLQASLAAGDGRKRLVVVDEAWAILHNLAIARWLQAGFKLSRAFGVAHVAVLHRLSDLRAAGAEGSEQQRLAEGLLADAETRVVFGQPPSECESAADLLGLTTTEAALLPQLPRGVALWKVGSRSFLVEHRLGAAEADLVDTDGAMREPPG
ncbi:MAG: VirB4 family type IV secretion system protein [Acidimicrobiales bacterium]